MAKLFLDAQGLELYDKLIKEYINNGAGAAVETEANRAKAAEKEILDALVALTNKSDAVDKLHDEALEKLNGDASVEGSVANQIKVAIDDLVAAAPETFDTLKEIADWIENDETGTAGLIARVTKNEKDIADLQAKDVELKAYVDDLYESIGSIQDAKISLLFRNKVEVAEGETVAAAIANLEANEVLELNGDEKIEDAVVVPAGAYINANGAEFAGDVVVDPSAVIENAVFTGKVTIA